MAYPSGSVKQHAEHLIEGPGGTDFDLRLDTDRRDYVLAIVHELLIDVDHVWDLTGVRSSMGVKLSAVEQHLRSFEEEVRHHPRLFNRPASDDLVGHRAVSRRRPSSQPSTKAATILWIREAIEDVRSIEQLDDLDLEVLRHASDIRNQLTFLVRALSATSDSPSGGGFII